MHSLRTYENYVKNDTNTNKNVFKNIFFDKVNAVSLDHFLQF